MRSFSSKFFLAIATLAVCGSLSWAESHHSLNGTWVLVPTMSNFGGGESMQTGTVTINDRQHNISVSRSFSYDSPSQTVAYSFLTDGRESASIREGKTFKTKAKWEDKVLVVRTTSDTVNETERFSLAPDGALMLVVERAGHPPATLYFHRQ